MLISFLKIVMQLELLLNMAALEIVKYLIENGANIAANNHYAVRNCMPIWLLYQVITN